MVDVEHNIYNEPVHEFLECTKKDALTCLYSYYVRHNLSWVALSDLAKLINTILGVDALPTTKYMFKKIFGIKDKSVVHLNCTHCNKYLGPKHSFENQEMIECETCNRLTSVNIKYKKDHFITFDVEKQLIATVESGIKNGHFDSTPSLNENIIDVHSSENFKKIKSKMPNSKYITLTLSTDGIVAQKAVKNKSLWPLQFFINEIKLQHRFKREYMMCAALAFGKTPDMSSYMKPFMDGINVINEKGGIEIRNGDLIERYLVVLALVTTDSVAKCYVLGKTQHNSHFGCPYCLHPGTNIPNSTQLKYCVQDNAADRTNEEATTDMLNAHINEQLVNGYRCMSPLLALDIMPFDVVWQVPIDKMHSIDLGVVKKLFNLFLDRKNRNEE